MASNEKVKNQNKLCQGLTQFTARDSQEAKLPARDETDAKLQAREAKQARDAEVKKLNNFALKLKKRRKPNVKSKCISLEYKE